MMRTYRLILRRANGRAVKEAVRRSSYAAKKLKRRWEDAYDETYYVEVQEQTT